MNFQSGEEESTVSKIDEEHDELCSMNEKKRPSKLSNPIHIGHHMTVSGHEAMNLAKRLSEELGTKNQTGSEATALNLPRAMSPECETISRSFEKKGKFINSLGVAHMDVSVIASQWDRTTFSKLICQNKQNETLRSSLSPTVIVKHHLLFWFLIYVLLFA